MVSGYEILLVLLVVVVAGTTLSFTASNFAESIILRTNDCCLAKIEKFETKGFKRLSLGNLIRIFCTFLIKILTYGDKIEDPRIRTAVKLNALSVTVLAMLMILSFSLVAVFYIVGFYIAFKLLMYMLWWLGGKPNKVYGEECGTEFRDISNTLKGLWNYNKPSKETAAIDLNNKGIEFQKQSMYDKALEYFNKSLELDQSDSVTWANKASVLDDLERYDEAITCIDIAMDLDTENNDLLAYKGFSLVSAERFNEAITWLDKATQLDPNQSTIWGYKACAFYNLDKYDEALKSCDRAIELDSNNAIGWFWKGNILSHHEKYDEALKCYEESLKIDSSLDIAKENIDFIKNEMKLGGTHDE